MISEKYQRRFWSRVDRTDYCWNWTAGKLKSGYGMFFMNGINHPTHRVSVILDGRDPSGYIVMHTCDNPSCVRPDHLIVATQKDNMIDMSNKGRCHSNQARGEQAGKSKLTEQQVLEIRRQHNMGRTQKSLALEYGLNKTSIFDIVHRINWKHI